MGRRCKGSFAPPAHDPAAQRPAHRPPLRGFRRNALPTILEGIPAQRPAHRPPPLRRNALLQEGSEVVIRGATSRPDLRGRRGVIVGPGDGGDSRAWYSALERLYNDGLPGQGFMSATRVSMEDAYKTAFEEPKTILRGIRQKIAAGDLTNIAVYIAPRATKTEELVVAVEEVTLFQEADADASRGWQKGDRVFLKSGDVTALSSRLNPDDPHMPYLVSKIGSRRDVAGQSGTIKNVFEGIRVIGDGEHLSRDQLSDSRGWYVSVDLDNLDGEQYFYSKNGRIETVPLKDLRAVQDSDRYFAVQPIANKGKGLVATEFIPRGTLLWVERPLVSMPSRRLRANMWSAPTWQQVEELKLALWRNEVEPNRKWTGSDADIYDDLAGGDPNKYTSEVSDETDRRRWSIFNTNAWQGADQIRNVFHFASRVNHTCSLVSNVVAAEYQGAQGGITVRRVVAETDINPGVELEWSYLADDEKFKTVDLRRDRIKSSWQFHCECWDCVRGETEPNFDTNRRALNALIEVLDMSHRIASAKIPDDFNRWLRTLEAISQLVETEAGPSPSQEDGEESHALARFSKITSAFAGVSAETVQRTIHHAGRNLREEFIQSRDYEDCSSRYFRNNVHAMGFTIGKPLRLADAGGAPSGEGTSADGGSEAFMKEHGLLEMVPTSLGAPTDLQTQLDDVCCPRGVTALVSGFELLTGDKAIKTGRTMGLRVLAMLLGFWNNNTGDQGEAIRLRRAARVALEGVFVVSPTTGELLMSPAKLEMRFSQLWHRLTGCGIDYQHAVLWREKLQPAIQAIREIQDTLETQRPRVRFGGVHEYTPGSLATGVRPSKDEVLEVFAGDDDAEKLRVFDEFIFGSQGQGRSQGMKDLSLALHPDRNSGNIEGATRAFQSYQELIGLVGPNISTQDFHSGAQGSGSGGA